MAPNMLWRLFLLAQIVVGHFQPLYPGWRADSFLDPYSQYKYPCAGVPTSDNRTSWPLDGGSILLDFHHPWTYTFVNLGFGPNVTNFNITLTGNAFWNETGNGTLCLSKYALPSGLGITDGTNATIQFVTVGAAGSALYNCADITFSSNATLLPSDQCKNSTGVSVSLVNEEVNGTTTGSTSSSSSSSGASSSASSGASRPGMVGVLVLFSAGLIASMLL